MVDKSSNVTRLTSQKGLILASLRSFGPVHPTSQMIYQAVRKKNPHISLGTVYRNLNSLREQGFVEEISVLNQPSHYDSRVDAHFHFLCESCQTLKDVENPKFFSANKQFLEKKGLLILNFNIVFTGLCAKCRKQKKINGTKAIFCTAHGKIKNALSKKNISCYVCRFQNECLYF